MAYLPSRKNLANESLRNCDVRQVLCILTIFCRFKPRNVCILPKFSSFQLLVILLLYYQLYYYIIHIMMTACAAAFRATVLFAKALCMQSVTSNFLELSYPF